MRQLAACRLHTLDRSPHSVSARAAVRSASGTAQLRRSIPPAPPTRAAELRRRNASRAQLVRPTVAVASTGRWLYQRILCKALRATMRIATLQPVNTASRCSMPQSMRPPRPPCGMQLATCSHHAPCIAVHRPSTQRTAHSPQPCGTRDATIAPMWVRAMLYAARSWQVVRRSTPIGACPRDRPRRAACCRQRRRRRRRRVCPSHASARSGASFRQARTAHAPSPVRASPQCAQRRTAWLGRAGNVDAIAIGAWRWSCSANCTSASCVLGPGTASGHRACARRRDGAVRRRPVRVRKRRRVRCADILHERGLRRLRDCGEPRHLRHAAARDRRALVPLEDHRRVRRCAPGGSGRRCQSAVASARGPLPLQGLQRLPRLGRRAARNTLGADRRLAHVCPGAPEVPHASPPGTYSVSTRQVRRKCRCQAPFQHPCEEASSKYPSNTASSTFGSGAAPWGTRYRGQYPLACSYSVRPRCECRARPVPLPRADRSTHGPMSTPRVPSEYPASTEEDGPCSDCRSSTVSEAPAAALSRTTPQRPRSPYARESPPSTL
jgi:hypothetical protein